MAFLTAELDDPHAAACGRCDVCAGPWYPTDVTVASAATAQAAAPTGSVSRSRPAPAAIGSTGSAFIDHGVCSVKGNIHPEEQFVEGRVAARLSDLGWGGTLWLLFASHRDGKPVDADVPPELAKACLRVLAQWGWAERPVAVGGRRARASEAGPIVGHRHRRGRPRVLGPLALTDPSEPRRGSTNSAYRVRDVWRRLAVPPEMAARLASLEGPECFVRRLRRLTPDADRRGPAAPQGRRLCWSCPLRWRWR